MVTTGEMERPSSCSKRDLGVESFLHLSVSSIDTSRTRPWSSLLNMSSREMDSGLLPPGIAEAQIGWPICH